VLDKSGYLAELHDSTDPQDETRLENLRELITVAREFVSGVATLTVPEDELDDLGCRRTSMRRPIRRGLGHGTRS
jgi:DNA helicase-2/ATP-dependent DNA helicase PcrA